MKHLESEGSRMTQPAATGDVLTIADLEAAKEFLQTSSTLPSRTKTMRMTVPCSPRVTRDVALLPWQR